MKTKKSFLNRFTRSLSALLLTLTFLIPTAKAEVYGYRQGNFLDSLKYGAYFESTDINMMNLVLAEIFGQQSGVIDNIMVDEFSLEFGSSPMRMPVLMASVMLVRDSKEGGVWVEYARTWEQLVDGEPRVQTLAVHISARGNVDAVEELDSVWNYLEAHTASERIWQETLGDPDKGPLDYYFSVDLASPEESMGFWDRFLLGAYLGDTAEIDLGWAGVGGQTAGGLVPYAGQVADARDASVALNTLWESGGADGKLDTTLAVIAAFPGAGDFVKGSVRMATKASKHAAQEVGGALAKKIDDFVGKAGKSTPPKGRSPKSPNGSSSGGARQNAWGKGTEFNGKKVFQRNDLIDLKLIDDRGRTNLQRMKQGVAPIGPDGNSINLHLQPVQLMTRV